MPRLWTDDHGEPGLRRKFDVHKPRDGFRPLPTSLPTTTGYPDSARLGADGEFVFVLRPETDAAACAALRTYAAAVSGRDTKLSQEIRAELGRIHDANKG